MSPVDYHGWTHAPKAQGGTDPIPLAAGEVQYAMISCVANQSSPLSADVVGDFTIFPPTDGYSSDPSVLEPDNTAIGIRVHEAGFIIATCRALGWNRWTGVGTEVIDAVKGCAPALVGSDILGVAYSLKNDASSVSGSAINEGDPNTITTDQFILTATDIVGAVVIHSATVDALITQLDVHVAWFASYPATNGQYYNF